MAWYRVPEHLRERVRQEWEAVAARFAEGVPPDGKMPPDLLEGRAAELEDVEPEVAQALREFAREVRRVVRMIGQQIPRGQPRLPLTEYKL